MGKSVHISTEIPPPEAMIQSLGIPLARQQELTSILDHAFASMLVAAAQNEPPERLRVSRLAGLIVAGASDETRAGLRPSGKRRKIASAVS